MRKNYSDATEDYLKTIYELTTGGERASTNQIAERMEVTPASVTGMLKRLASNDPPLIEYLKHRGVQLTPDGENVALEVIRHHRLIELFLHETLGYSWDEVHKEADRLEHVISEELEERITQALGDPVSDPHGEPIPTRELVLPSQPAIHLTDLRAGQEAIIRRVEDDNPDLLRYFFSLGLVPETTVQIVDYSQFDGNISLRVSDHDKEVVLGPKVTRHIYVEVL